MMEAQLFRSAFLLLQIAILFFSVAKLASGQYADWKHSGSMFVLTTPEGANLKEGQRVEKFPLLVRLHGDWFDFSQCMPDGSDIRFATSQGQPLPYQIDEWDATRSTAWIWVQVPEIVGNTRQELKLFWGNKSAKSESSSRSVFSEENHYRSVWHMGHSVVDEVGTLQMKDVDTTLASGVVGLSRHLAGGQGVFGGESISNYPSGGSSHSTQAWFRCERPNSTILGWGNEGGGRGSKVRMQFRSPPHIHIDSDFSDVDAPQRLPMREWIHVIHTYENGEGKIYLNGKLAASDKPKLNIKSPSRLWLGGWYHNYDFIGDLDEIRISDVARSPAWIQLEYENQKEHSTLVGPIVQAGDSLNLSASSLTVGEGKEVEVTANIGGAQKVYWKLQRTKSVPQVIVGTDRTRFTFNAGRVVGDQTATLQLQAIYPEGIKTKELRLSISDDVPEPVFKLKGPAIWNGREAIEIVPNIANRQAMETKGHGQLNYAWTVDGIATIKRVEEGKLILTRAQNSGTLIVSVAIDNGGNKVTDSLRIEVQEPTPSRDRWVERVPDANERPVDNQFFARNDEGEGRLHYCGEFPDKADRVFLRLFADDKLVQEKSVERKSSSNREDSQAYDLSATLQSGLIKYRTEFGTEYQGQVAILHSATNLICGDVFLIQGQSNAVATDFGKENPLSPSPWIRSFGSTDGGPQGSRLELWDNAQARSPGGRAEIGYWGMELGRRLVESNQIPVCILNGAVGGTRIDQHQRNLNDPTDVASIYGRLLWRVKQAKLAEGVRAILWHQGENDQGADGPTGGFGWETYREYFVDLAGAWKEDYPNLQHYYAFQIWPKACAMGVQGSDNRLREVQRNLPSLFSNLTLMSTLGVKPPGGCHYPAEGYAEFARLIAPAIEYHIYKKAPTTPFSPPNLRRAFYPDSKRDAIVLEFDFPVVWSESLTSQFYLDGDSKKIDSAISNGNRLTLKLKEPTHAAKIGYIDSASWSPDNLLIGENGLAALTFWDVLIEKE